MFWKIVILFLCAMVLVGMVGKVLFPPKTGRRGAAKFGVARCKSCGKPRIGKAPCTCQGPRG